MSNTSTLFETVLDNGLKVAIVTDPATPMLAVRTYIRAGAITEGACLGQGISHFLEHLVAGGPTQFRSEADYKVALSMLGGGYNAYTTTDHTCYYINSVPENAEEALKILSEWMFFNTFGTSEFEREREVITREIEKNGAELGRVFYQQCQSLFYQNHPMRYPVIGFLENFKKTTIQQLKSYYQTHYTPTNMILSVGSPIPAAELMPWIHHYFGRVPMVAPPTFPLTIEPTPFVSRKSTKQWDTSTVYYSIRFSTTDLFSSDLFALDVLDFILTNGEDSLLYQDIVDEKKLAYSVSSSSYTPSVTTGYFDVTFEADESDLDAVKEALFAHLQRISLGELAEHRVARAKKQKLSEEAFSIATIEDAVSRVGQGLLYGHSAQFYEHYARHFRDVSTEDMVRVVNKYFASDRIVETILMPRQPESKAISPTIIVPSLRLPTLHTLPNGVRVLVYPETSYPRVITKTFFEGGIRRETAENNGIGTVMADMLGTGTSDMSKLDIARFVENRGADISSGIGTNTLYTTLECMTDDLSDLMPLYIKTMTDVRFDPSELKETRRQVLKWISQRKDDWYRYANYQFKKSFFDGHPYGMALNGEPGIVKSLSVDDLVGHFSRHWNPSRIVMSVVGDVEAARVLDLVAPMGAIDRKGVAISAQPFSKHNRPLSQNLSVEQDIAAVFMAFDGVTLGTDTESLRLDLVNTVLSGMNYPAGRLHNLLRDEGLVYLTHGVNFIGVDAGYLLLYALTSLPHQQRVFDIMTRQTELLKTESITDREYEQAIAQMQFFFKDRVASLDALASIVAVNELLGRGFDFFEKQAAAVKSLTPDHVKDYAARYFVNPQVYWFNQGRTPQ